MCRSVSERSVSCNQEVKSCLLLGDRWMDVTDGFSSLYQQPKLYLQRHRLLESVGKFKA